MGPRFEVVERFVFIEILVQIYLWLVVGYGVYAWRTPGAGNPRATSSSLQDSRGTVGTLPSQCGEIRRPTQQVHLPHGASSKYTFP